MQRLRHVLLKTVRVFEYIGNIYIPSACLREYYFILVAGFPSRFVYFCTYGLLLPFLHHIFAAVVATVAYWVLNYRILQAWVIEGGGNMLREGVFLLMFHGSLQFVNVYIIHVLVTGFGWHVLLAPFGASFVYGCVAVPATRLIFSGVQRVRQPDD